MNSRDARRRLDETEIENKVVTHVVKQQMDKRQQIIAEYIVES